MSCERHWLQIPPSPPPPPPPLWSQPACSSCSAANGSLWFPGSAPEMFSCGDLVRSALSWSLRLPLGLSTLFIPRPPRPQTAKWVELWPVMWSGPGVTGERPESVELTTLLTIKRQPDTGSSSPTQQSRVSQRREAYSEPTNEPDPAPGSRSVSQAGQQPQHRYLPYCGSHTVKMVMLSLDFFPFVLFLAISVLPYFFAPHTHLFLICLFTSVFFNHLRCHFSFFSLSAPQLNGRGGRVINTQG